MSTIPFERPRAPPGVFILWMNELRCLHLKSILSGCDHRFGSEETGITTLDDPNALKVGAEWIKRLRDAQKSSVRIILHQRTVSLFDIEFAKFCGHIWQGVDFSCWGWNEEGFGIIRLNVTLYIRDYWTRERKQNLVPQYKYELAEWKRWFRPYIYINKKKELKEMYSKLEEEKWQLYSRLREVEDQQRGLEKIDFPYLDMAINKYPDPKHNDKYGYPLVPKNDQHWFKKMVHTPGAWSEAET